MTRLRHALGRVAITWLLYQAATLTLAPTVFWFGSAHADLLECTCSDGDHTICPMHHKPAPASKLCLMQRADDHGIAVPSWLLSGIGLVPASIQPVPPVTKQSRIVVDVRTTPLRPAPPDPPPPRA